MSSIKSLKPVVTDTGENVLVVVGGKVQVVRKSELQSGGPLPCPTAEEEFAAWASQREIEVAAKAASVE